MREMKCFTLEAWQSLCSGVHWTWTGCMLSNDAFSGKIILLRSALREILVG